MKSKKIPIDEIKKDNDHFGLFLYVKNSSPVVPQKGFAKIPPMEKQIQQK